VVCVTQGLLEAVSDAELEGVIAHELAHIRHRDMLLMTVTATLAAAISHLAFLAMFMGGRGDDEGGNPIAGLALIILAPLAAMLIQLAIGRQREFKADAAGAEISGQPLALASALKKLDALAHRVPLRVEPAMAPLAQVNPLAAFNRGVLKLFATHPPTTERVAKLEALAFAGA
jgi:heat shock protein HtpX